MLSSSLHPSSSVCCRPCMFFPGGRTVAGLQPTCSAGFYERKPKQTQGEHANSTDQWRDCTMTLTCTCAYKTKSLKLKAFSLRCWTIFLLLWSICSALSDPHMLHMLTRPRLHCSQVCPCVSALQSSTDTRRPAAPSASHSAAHLWCLACIAGWFAAPCAVGNLVFHLGWRNDEGIIVLLGGFLFIPNYTFYSICLGLQSLKWPLSE